MTRDDRSDPEALAIQRATQRPDHVRPPAHWHSTPPPPPALPVIKPDAQQPGGRNPVRYGDWEYKGLAIDF